MIIKRLRDLFNARRRGMAALLLPSLVVLAAPGGLPAAAAEEEPAPELPSVELTAVESQAAARLRGAWWLGRGVGSLLWKDFDPNRIPVLLVEAREGRPPFALLMNHPNRPEGFSLALPEDAGGPAVYRAEAVSLPAGKHVPARFAGEATAIYRRGLSQQAGDLGAPSGEAVTSRILREMIHVYQASRGLPPDLVPATPPPFPDRPEVIALAAVEGRILTEFIYTDRTRTRFLTDLALQFLAIRKARWSLMGEAADWERRMEIREGPAIFAALEVIKSAGRKLMEPPPIQDQDPAYASFRFALVPRVKLLLAPLVSTPTGPGHLRQRAAMSGGALVTVLDRLGIDWLAGAMKPEGSLPGILEAGLGATPAELGQALQKAREAFGYTSFLRLARARTKNSTPD